MTIVYALFLASVMILPSTSSYGSSFDDYFTATTPPKNWGDKIHFVNDADEKIKISDFKGKVVLLNLWALWCKPCLAEMPLLSKLQEEYKDKDLLIVPLNIDNPKTSAVSDFFKENNISNFPVYRDKKFNIYNSIGLQGLPTTIIFNKQGEEVGRVKGVISWHSKDAKSYLSNLLEQTIQSTDNLIKQGK